jgi:hypothetical protein
LDKEIFTCGAQIIYGTSGLLDPAFETGLQDESNAKKKLLLNIEQMLIKLDYLFTLYYTQTLKFLRIYPGISICVEDTDLVGSLNSRNKTLSQFLIILAKKYNKIIK